MTYKDLLIIKEMADALSLDLADKGMVTDQLMLSVGYDVENLAGAEKRARFSIDITFDYYGRAVSKPTHGSGNLVRLTAFTKLIVRNAAELYGKNSAPRSYGAACHHSGKPRRKRSRRGTPPEQFDIITDVALPEREKRMLVREKEMQKAVLKSKRRFGKNAVVKAMDLEDGATSIQRNAQVGGHRA